MSIKELDGSDLRQDTQRKSSRKNIVWHESAVTREQRASQNGHRSAVVWLTGLSGAGKSTLANAIDAALYAAGCRCIVLDGDNIRHGLCADLGFSAEDRRENVRRIGETAKLFSQAGIIALVPVISPYRKDRDSVRNALSPEIFCEVYCRCPVDICEQRDVKGLYRRARSGEIEQFTGISSPYEEPENPELVIDTGTMSLQECVAKVMEMLIKKGVVPKRDPAPSLNQTTKTYLQKTQHLAVGHQDEPSYGEVLNGYPYFKDIVKEMLCNDPILSDRILEPDGKFQTRRTTLKEITRSVVKLNADALKHRSVDDLPTIIFSWGKCRVGSTALTNLFGIAGIPAYYNPIKTAIRHFVLNGIGEAWNVPSRSEHEFIFSKNMSGPYHIADCTVNSLQILVEAGYPTDKIELLVLDRDPYKALDSWLNIWGHLILEEKLVQHYVLSALNVLRIKAYAAKVGIRTSHYVYETSRIPDKAVGMMFRRLGIERLYKDGVAENWNEKGALASPHSKIIFPELPEPFRQIPGMHASEPRYLYKERKVDSVLFEHRALIEQTGVIERYRETALYCAEEMGFSRDDREKVFQGTVLDIGNPYDHMDTYDRYGKSDKGQKMNVPEQGRWGRMSGLRRVD